MLPAPLRPRWDGRPGRFEIWFLVVFDRASRRAFWLRHTLFAAKDGGPARATVWAALFDPDLGRVAGKRFAPLPPGPVGWPLETLGCVLHRDRAEGRLDDLLGWSLRFPPADGAPARLPHLPESLPAPTRAWHLLSEAPAAGTVRHAGRELTLDGPCTMMHLEGTRRVDELAWCYAPMCDEPDGSAVELTCVRPRRRGPLLWGLWQGELLAGLSFARARVTQPRPGALRAVVRDGARTVVARAWSPPEEMVGYVYRDPAGHDLHVAQSDVASLVVDIYGRRGRRERRLVRRRGAALEIHQREPLPGVAYLGWDERDLPAAPARPPRARPAGEGAWEPLPPPGAILALGLTYADHLRETGHDPDRPPPPVIFPKQARTFLPEGDTVVEPGAREILAAIADLDPDLAARLGKRLPQPPALLDWEGELALVVLEDLDDGRLDDPGVLPVGLCAANDVTARSVQILGEGAARSLHFWAAAKSFPGFLPIAPEVWRPPGGGLATAWPDLTVELRVNGRVRQRGRTADLVVSPRSALRLARDAVARPLRRGDIVLTGTPGGIALQLSRWKRRLAALLLDRIGRLAVAARGAIAGRFLEPGDEVSVEAGPAGARTVVISA